ncbi:MAG: pyridoxal-phosphate dependent enzyme [Chitinophagaceae bacterium]|nr:MAG: pyridoxal-phosphate dependent enzyme [Chitinophagaceae bacterium]
MPMNSPLQEIEYNGYTLHIKRDDLIDPFVSGNKARKLKYILEAAKREGKSHLVTFGGAYSNHLVAAAAAAARNGLESTAFVRGEAVENEMLLLCKLFGMRLIFTSREAYLDKPGLFLQNFGADANAYFIDEGGAGPDAARGCAELVADLPQDTDHIFCSAGTGTTAAGILNGMQEYGSKASLEIVPAIKGGDGLTGAISLLTDQQNYTMHTDHHFGGYAKTTPELISFIKGFTAKTGILIDPVYTGKMFFAINALITEGKIARDKKIVAIHTGGLLGIWGMRDKFSVL